MQTEHFESVSKPGSNQASLISEQFLPFFVDSFKLNNTKLKFLKQTFFTSQSGYRFGQKSFFMQQLNRKIVQVVESGLMNHWKSDHDVKKVAEAASGPEVLTLIHLGIGFEIYVICVLIACFTFACEIVTFNIRNYIKNKIFLTFSVTEYLE